MKTFLIIKNTYNTSSPASTVLLLPKNDFKLLEKIHKWITQKLWIEDGNNPHNFAARERGSLIAILKDPISLSIKWGETALKMITRGDTLMNFSGGLMPRDDKIIEIEKIVSDNWPLLLRKERWIYIKTWGKHYYLTSSDKIVF